MSVSDQLFVSHFPIPQGLRVMISQILLTCLSSRIGRTHYLKCTSSGHCNHFCPVCQFSVDDADDPYLATTINDLAPILTSPKRRPVSCGSIGSELRLLKSLILRDRTIRRQWFLLSPRHHHQRHLLTAISLLIKTRICQTSFCHLSLSLSSSKAWLLSEKIVFVTCGFSPTTVWTAAAASDGGNCLPSPSLHQLTSFRFSDAF